MPAPSTRASMLERVRDLDDHLAWREFEATYRELVLRYGLRRGLSAHDAEDVLQAVLLRLAKRLPTFRYDRGAGRFRSYLGRTVENEIHRHFGRQDRATARVEELSEDPPEIGNGHEVLWHEEWTLHHYRRAMTDVRSSFPARSLAVFEGLLGGASPQEVGREHGLSDDAVYKIKQRIRDRLRERIAEQMRDEEGHAQRG